MDKREGIRRREIESPLVSWRQYSMFHPEVPNTSRHKWDIRRDTGHLVRNSPCRSLWPTLSFSKIGRKSLFVSGLKIKRNPGRLKHRPGPLNLDYNYIYWQTWVVKSTLPVKTSRNKKSHSPRMKSFTGRLEFLNLTVERFNNEQSVYVWMIYRSYILLEWVSSTSYRTTTYMSKESVTSVTRVWVLLSTSVVLVLT